MSFKDLGTKISGLFSKDDDPAYEQVSEEQKLIDEKYMAKALKQAKKAADLNETPIGAIIVKDDEIIAKACNLRNTEKNTIAHAEMLAVKKACKYLKDWRLEGCTMYVTLEPCQMCAGALVQARIDRVVIGAMSPKSGCAGSILNILNNDRFNHQVKVTKGVMEKECRSIMKEFFKNLRSSDKKDKKTAEEE